MEFIFQRLSPQCHTQISKSQQATTLTIIAANSLINGNSRQLIAIVHNIYQQHCKIDIHISISTIIMSPPTSSNAADGSSMIIFDWDDTILPSSFVDRAPGDNLNDLPEQYKSIFREIELCTEKCFEAASKHGEVSI